MHPPFLLPSPLNLSIDELRTMLQHEIYGLLPPAPDSVTVAQEIILPDTCAGKAICKQIRLTVSGAFGTYSFPIRLALPVSEKPAPAFLLMNFRPDFPDRYLPVEEIIDHGFAVISLCYTDITSDDDDFSNGLAALVFPEGRKNEADCGKIALWAWAAICVHTYLRSVPELDIERIAVCGHSRLGKTALLAGAMDGRFACAISNDSGCGGAALARENTGETIADICRKFPYWFSARYRRYIGREHEMPLDQHFLIAANATHKVYIASAEKDAWACPKNEFYSALAASAYYEKQGKPGLMLPHDFVGLPQPGDCFHDGQIGYHLRHGTHYLSREDWSCYIRYLTKS